ncbi:MAG: ABC transporter permease [Clostridia bacterium]|nr:ABC transporter permease [Clostridia bacterium]
MNILHKVTRKVLALNKMRTWVTVIGIVLSAAMFTAVFTCVSSVQNYLYRVTEATEGSWHGVRYDADSATLTEWIDRSEVREHTVLETVGYAEIGSSNAFKPYLMVRGIDDAADSFLPIDLQQGRMPQNSKELLLPAHLEDNGDVSFAIGDQIALNIGDRILEGTRLTQQDPFADGEGLVVRQSQTYTVVGFYARPEFEPFSAPGYTALTYTEGAVARGDLYLKLKTPREIYRMTESLAEHQYAVNTQLLRYMGMSNEGGYNQVLYGLATILIGIICFGSIALIYNAFSISVGERTKQFGILKTIGATNRQLRSSVLYEAGLLSCIGIPLGILSGILGIGITLHFTGRMFDTLLERQGISLQLHVSLAAVVGAAAVCLATVLVSAWIPAARAMRQNAIDSVRNRADITIRAKKVKSPRWLYKLFGFEGVLADKNFKRNRRKYRATVASLFVSVLLFVTAGSFCSYITRSGETAVYAGNYEITFRTDEEFSIARMEQQKQELQALDAVNEAIWLHRGYREITIADEDLHSEYLEYRREQAEATGDPPEQTIGCNLYFIDEALFRRWASEQGIDPEPYFKKPMAIAVDRVSNWNSEGNRIQVIRHLKKEQTDFSFQYIPDQIGDYFWENVFGEEGKLTYLYRNEAGETLTYEENDPILHINGRIGAVSKEDPFGTNRSSVMLIYPASMFEQAVSSIASVSSWEFRLQSDTPDAAVAQIGAYAQEQNFEGYELQNLTAGDETDRALIVIINVFSYGFIILISLIALANVFNTISTNVTLRRREFAMLRSVGLTEKGLNKMMNYECILYGVKGLSYGLIAAVLVTYLIYLAIRQGMDTEFYIPWYSITIAVASVFIVVFATMLYAMRKIKKEDPIEALKDENM